MDQAATSENGINLSFLGLLARCPRLVKQGLVTIATVDSSQGDESDLVIFCTTRANANRVWGFIDNPHRANVGYTRTKAGTDGGTAATPA